MPRSTCRFASLADILRCRSHVRFTPESGHARADELEKAATIKGLYGELAEAARPYGGIEGYVRHQFEQANRGPKVG